MPDATQVRQEREQRALIDRILASPGFAPASERKRFLAFLFEHRNAFLSAKQISHLFYGKEEETSRVRMRCDDLRGALKQYAPDIHDVWCCTLPQSEHSKGYRLELRLIQRTAAERFWWPHVECAARLAIVTNALLFFYDYEEHRVMRFFDINDEPTSEQSLAALGHKHRHAFAPGLKPVHFYLAGGEVTACEMLQRWFWDKANTLPPRRVSREMTQKEILNSSPILLGNRHTNRIIHRMLESREAQHLAYRFGDQLGTVQIREPREAELHALSRFGITPEGHIGPTRNWEVIFGIATRLPHPGGSGPVTIISSDFTSLGMAKVVEALTSDEKADKLLKQMDWPSDKPLPASFEMLFTLRLAPGNIEGELSNPELVCWRMGEG